MRPEKENCLKKHAGTSSIQKHAITYDLKGPSEPGGGYRIDTDGNLPSKATHAIQEG